MFAAGMSPAAAPCFVATLVLLGMHCVTSERSDAASRGSNLRLRANHTFGQKAAFGQERGYSENSLCRQNNCVNPIFPGLNDLPRLEALSWQCSTHQDVQSYMDFCKDAVIYDPALPSPVKAAQPIEKLVQAQDDAAMTMFMYHLSGMGYDAWDYQRPALSDSDCVRSVWKMVCFTYFPRSAPGCQKGQQSLYRRPCKSCCQNYIAACGVECCDESVQCNFAHTKTGQDGKLELVQTGYVDVDGPAASCTGGSSRAARIPFALIFALFGLHWAASASSGGSTVSASCKPRHAAERCAVTPWARRILLAVIASSALVLQGCGVPSHELGNWRAEPNYLSNYGVIPAGSSSAHAVLNSCNTPNLSPAQRCSGRGFCKGFTTKGLTSQGDKPPLAFCMCEQGYADPECGTKRKSQSTAFFYSLFLGVFGADYFYLGFPWWGIGKLFTLGGLGFWWVTDILRIASGPVYAYNFRTANDLSHWFAMLIIISIFMLLGFFAAIETYLIHRRQKRDHIGRLQLAEETNHYQKMVEKGMHQGEHRNVQARNYGAAFAC